MPLAECREMDQAKEIEKGFTQEMAIQEARRCLQCGLICYQHVQPDLNDISVRAS